jgi:large subunit ribosomal protein L14e
MIFDIGRVCIKLAGRDAGKTCVIVDTIDETKVLIDGQTRRRTCNMVHLEPTKKMLDITKGADTSAVAKAFEAQGITVIVDKKSKQTPARPKKLHVQKNTKKK